MNQTKIMIPILLIFLIVNFAIFLGGLENWLGMDLSFWGAVLLVAVKLIIFLGLLKIILSFLDLDEHPLLIAGIVLSVLVVFSNTYFQKYQKAVYQKQTIGTFLEIPASELKSRENLEKTPYLKIINSGIGEIKKFRKCISPKCNEAVGIFEDFCYANVLNTEQPVFIVEECRNGLLEELSGKSEFFAEILLKKSRYSELNGLQLVPIQKNFSEYCAEKYQDFLTFIKIVNGIILIFVLIFLYFKWR
jgi:hypothetical protein